MASHRDPNLTPKELADERWVLSLLHEIGQEVRAPRRLRLRIEAETRSRRSPVLGLRGLAALASRGAISPAPAPDPDDPSVKLSESVDDVYFPNWSSTLGWQATGQRRDLLNDHPAITVYYAASRRRLAYTIVSGSALAQPAARVTVTDGMTLRTLRLHGHLIVTWRRDGRTCVLTGTKVSAAQLRELAVTNPPPDAD
jgi:hypothetical protein